MRERELKGMENKCPKCRSIIYSRRNVLCGVCGERLPSQLLFSTEEREAVEREMAEIKRREKQARDSENDFGGTGTSDGVCF